MKNKSKFAFLFVVITVVFLYFVFNREDIFKPEFLTICSVYEITPIEPKFKTRMEEGNIAFYGLILQAEDNEKIKNYLLENSKESLWEYQHNYGVTSEDSAIVIEGLLKSGVDKKYLCNSLKRIVDIYYSLEDGAFKTVIEGGAEYWKGVSIETTAHIAYLLSMVDPESYSKEIVACAKFVQNSQSKSGFWNGKWFPSMMIPTYYSVRFLNILGEKYADNIERAKEFILHSQEKNGSWDNSVIETSVAILTLKTIKCPGEAQEKGKKWLLSKKREGGWEGEPVLYYWLEAEGNILFYDCRDKGQITTAWAKLALKD